MKRIVSGIMLTLLLIGMSTWAFSVQEVKATGTIYIKADGSVDPSTASISTIDNVTYTLTDNINDFIVVERDNIVVDGAGFALQGMGSGTGIGLANRSNVTIENMEIKEFEIGIWGRFSSNNSISGNNIRNNRYGIELVSSPNNKISANNITNNQYGIELFSSYDNGISGNNITNNQYGIFLPYSYDNGVSGNNITANADQGIRLDWSSNNSVSGNNITNNGVGIAVYSSYDNSISGNNITANNYWGVYTDYSSNNIFYHNNFINNGVQVGGPNSVDTWDDGYPSGGNYWSDYTGVDEKRGPNQDLPGSDGIGDTEYVIDANNRDRYPLLNPWGPPWKDWEHYHNYTEIVRTLIYLNYTYPNIVDVFSVGKSWQDRDIYCFRLTNESTTRPKPRVFFVGYHHARELISAELPLYFIVEAATKYGTNETITRMLNYSEIYIVVALNVDAFDVVKANEWQRKNVHPFDEDEDALFDEDPPDDEDGDGYIEYLFFWDGINYEFIRWEGLDDDADGWLNEDWVGGVDLNRNYGYKWDEPCQSGSPYPWAEDYRGPEPFSEPETQAIRDLALQHSFKYAISFHSGAEVIGYPWGHTTDPPVDDVIFREIAANLSTLVGAPYSQSGTWYTTSGVWDDWMYSNRSTFALTCEIYTNNSAWQNETGPEPDTYWEKGVFQFFNPEPNDIETVIQRWLPVFTYITNRAITEAYDTATTNVTPLKTIVGQGYSMKIKVTIANQGEFAETFLVTVYANTTIIETKEVTLTSGSLTTITFTWNATGFAKGNYTISAYAWPILGETDTDDNTFTDGWVLVAMVGDITGPTGLPDGKVDLRDVFAVALAFGSFGPDYLYPGSPPHPRWNQVCDINNDNTVDLKDYFAAALNYGKVDP